MFGRVRAASSSLDSLERPPSKIFKDDPLSIYETTLIKLKLGSQRDLNSPSPSEEAGEEMESDCSTITVSTSCVEQPIFSTSTIISETSQLLVTSLDGDAMAIDTDSSSASACQSTGTKAPK
ncbi:hypothetical protein RCOM_1507320 [Ricinus communis]|uniref:Uncharacterized protein n=1 Tax=Ricinus communis TaxID=3988 RepID=B9RAM2_RICCO|nr:hypothetical protein RCOM_1507320 [Ricinus communis]